MTLNDATLAQQRAADPGASTWLSANAGSGKTRVLTDRVARLLLNGVSPQNILCLTYTKAAASEMQNRLFRLLGDWALKEDGALRDELARLGADGTLGADDLARARRLFARAIETPGGLRIQTIHSFCASLLRRFPLEARVSPQFTEMDDRTAQLIRAEIVEAMADGPEAGLVDALAVEYTGDDFAALTAGIVRNRVALGRGATLEDIQGWLGLPPGAGPHRVLGAITDGSEPRLMDQLLPILHAQSKSYAELGKRLAAVDWTNPSDADYRALCGDFLYASGERKNGSKSANFPQSGHKAAVAALAPVIGELHALMDRVALARQYELALDAARRTLALYRFAGAFLPAYEARKLARGWLDFDDLILKTRDLLTDPTVAAWVLYRLDGGLDHILVDEAQDTSPEQWQVIAALAQEMAAGLGAEDGRERTIFVVGDQKQSIYSFQGADPAEFDRMRAHFAERLAERGGLQRQSLEYSFRSSSAILGLVDLTFPDWQGSPDMRPDMRHRAFHQNLPGRVDLWPVIAPGDDPEDLDWFDTGDRLADSHHTSRLARAIADEIARMIAEETLPVIEGGRKPVQAGDVLILVRRRSPLFHEIIRACKKRDLPVAGADRLRLGGELAVRDIAALLSFLATPEDDLSLAAALRSPLLGWSEDRLFRLAAGRGGQYLWRVLQDRRDDHPETVRVLEELRDNADYLRPYDLIERILIRHGGRQNLLSRLGQEAEDGIDSLLSQALAYERTDVPSLTGFLTWLQTEEVEVKRQPDSAGDRIRVMTVHGAKGLESPIVILPDTGHRDMPVRDEIVTLDNGAPVWKPPADKQPEPIRQAVARTRQAQQAEDLRLLYVAMTRAEKWLIVCAAGDPGKPGASWYQRIAEAMGHAGAVTLETPTGRGQRLAHHDWTGGALAERAVRDRGDCVVPGWANVPVACATRPAQALSPSGLGGAKLLAGETDGTDKQSAMQRGSQMHLLLEHLPLWPRADWPDLARDLLTIGEDALDAGQADALLADAARVLDDPELQPLFARDALTEVNLTAALPPLGGARINGAIDRLILTDDTVLAIDYKTNRVVPSGAAEVPEGLLRQMGAYDAALRQIYPGRRVEVAILWTAAALLMPLPHDIVSVALARSATS